MSEDETRHMNPRLLQQILSKLEAIDLRLQAVEERLERRSFDTKPIWEKALVEIVEVKNTVRTIERKFDVLGKDMIDLRAKHLDIEERLDDLETERGGVQTIG